MINKNNTRNEAVQNTTASDNTAKVLRPAIIKAVIAAVLLIAAVTVYILLPAEFKNPGAATESQEAEIVLLEGEVQAGNNAIYVFEPLSSSDLQMIEVENTNCSYTLTKADDGGFYLNGNKQMTYSDSAFSSLIVATGNTITSERVYPDLATGSGPDVINYASFGLDEASMNGRYTLTTARGEKYTVRVGNMAPSGDGYYACLEGRDAVYILADDLQNTVLGTAESIVDPTLGLQNLDVSDEESNSINHLTVWHGGKHVNTIHTVGDEGIELIDDIYNFAMSCNQEVKSEDLLNCDNLTELEKLIGINAITYSYVPGNDEYNEIANALPNLTGDETVALKDADAGTITAEQLTEFGIDMENPAYEIFYTYSSDDEDLIYNYLIFSEQVDGYYYVYSNLNKVIAKISADTVYFLDWDYSRWVEPNFFQKYITSLSEIKVQSDKADLTFKLNHGADSEGTATLVVTESNNILDTTNFRNFYRVILSRNIRGVYEGEKPGEDKLYLTLTVTTTENKVIEYKFYRANAQQALITINGEGEFYCLFSGIRKLENDAIKAANGETVNFEDWN